MAHELAGECEVNAPWVDPKKRTIVRRRDAKYRHRGNQNDLDENFNFITKNIAFLLCDLFS